MPVLSFGQRLRLRHLVRQSPELADVASELRDDDALAVVLPTGRVVLLPLETLARQAADVPTEEWPGLVDEYLRRSLRRMRQPSELTGPTDAIIDRIYPRLFDGSDYEYAEPFGPDLVVLFALDEPEFVTMLHDEAVAAHGPERLREAAVANLRRRDTERTVEEHDGTYVVRGDEHTAAGAVILPDLVTKLTGQEAPDLVLFAVPCQDTLVFRGVDDDLATAVLHVTQHAKPFYDKGTHPISEQAYGYWWRRGEVARATVTQEPTLGEKGMARLHELIRASQALHGREVAFGPDRITVSGTHPHYLLKLASFVERLRERPGQDWPEEVDTLLRLALIVANDPPEFAQPTETVLAKAYPQLLRPDVVPDPAWWAYARNTLPGVLDVLAIDLIPDGGGVHTFHDDHLGRHGADRVREAAMRNLRQVAPWDHTTRGGVHVLSGGVHTAATALILDEVIEATTGERELPDGALVALPMRQVLCYHVPRDEGMREALARLGAAVADHHREHPLDSFGPAVYWWRDGVFHQLAQFDDGGGIEWRMPPEFAVLYRRLCPELPARPPELDGPTEAIADLIRPALTTRADLGYPEALAPGLVVALAYHGVVLSDEDVDRHGGVAALREIAWRNFTADDHRIRVTTDDGTCFVHGTGHLPAAALSLRTLVSTVTGEPDPVGDVLFGAPNEDTAVLRVLRDGDDAAREAERLAPVVAGLHDESDRRISRWVYRWRDGAFERAT